MEFVQLSSHRRQVLSNEGIDPEYLFGVIANALREDLDGGCDVTTEATVSTEQRSRADVVARKDGIVSGLDVAASVFEIVSGESVTIKMVSSDSRAVRVGEVVMSVEGPTRSILTAERTALNLLCHLSGIATVTSRWVAEIEGTGAKIRDTRKTTPGLRRLEKYAVRCGGGHNHRMSLSDAALVKDNHVIAANGITNAVILIRSSAPDVIIEVEVDTLEQLRETISSEVDLVLLDNMDLSLIRQAVAMVDDYRQQFGTDVLLEVSGGIQLEHAREIAFTGVDFLSVGSLTHSSIILDFGLDFVL